jgi:hypothetical protein
MAASLTEPGIAAFLTHHLQQCHQYKENYYNFMINLGLFVVFIIILVGFLYMSYTPRSPAEWRKKEEEKKKYILDKIRKYKKNQQAQGVLLASSSSSSESEENSFGGGGSKYEDLLVSLPPFEVF